MGAEWRERALGELCSLKYGKFVAKKNLDGGEYPVFSGYGVVGYHSEYLYEDPQLVVVCRGVGGSGDVKMSPARCWITNLAIVVTPKSTSDILASFLYWALQSSNRSGWISGSAQHQVTIAHLEQHRVRFPSLDQQRVIAHILCALDDKIELNRRMSQTLEEMARALFKSWFVDFDPVHAKAAGKKPFGMDEATAALFPDSFEDSELGRIPNGWRVMPLDEVANFKNGLALQKYRPEEGGARLPVVKIAQLRTGRADSAEWARADIDSECVLQDGDVVFSWSGSLMVGLWCGGEAALNQHLFKVSTATRADGLARPDGSPGVM